MQKSIYKKTTTAVMMIYGFVNTCLRTGKSCCIFIFSVSESFYSAFIFCIQHSGRFLFLLRILFLFPVQKAAKCLFLLQPVRFLLCFCLLKKTKPTRDEYTPLVGKCQVIVTPLYHKTKIFSLLPYANAVRHGQNIALCKCYRRGKVGRC